MIKLAVLKAHIWVYQRVLRYLFLIFFVIIAVNLTVQLGITTYYQGIESLNMTAALSPLLGFLIGILIASPAMMMTAFPYLLTFGSRRIDMVQSASFNIIITAGFVATMLSILIGTDAATTEHLAPFYMGTIITTWRDLIPVTMFNLVLFTMVASLVFTVSGIFYRWGLLWGLGAIALGLTVPALMLNNIYQFYIWGGSYVVVGIAMMAIILSASWGSYGILAKADIRPNNPKWQLKGFVFFISTIIIFSLATYTGVNKMESSHTIRVNDHGRFAYFEHGEKEKELYIRGNQELVLSWRSQVRTGDLTFILLSPDGDVRHTITGSENEITNIPLTPGRWTYKLVFDEATDGNYSMRAMVRDR